MGRYFCCLLLLLTGLQLVGCAAPRVADQAAQTDIALVPWATASFGQSDVSAWHHLPLPGKQPTQFSSVLIDGRNALAVSAVSSASMLRKKVRIEPAALSQLRFSWKVPALMTDADMALRDADDAPVRVVLAFEGDRSKFSAKNAMLSEVAHLLTGEELPYATLMYVWCNKRAPGSVIFSPRTDRIRKLVVETGASRLNRWLDYERDIRADFIKLFGEEPGALVAIGVMTDSDNTRSTTSAWYGPVWASSRASARIDGALQ